MYSIINRRSLLTGASALVAIAPFERALAWTTPTIDPSYLTSGTWFEQVKAQHVAITETLVAIIDEDGASTAELHQLSYLLTAHSVAEENVLYPALALAGLTVDAADLYLEQQFQKILNAEIDYKAAEGQSGVELLDKIKHLQDIILPHAKEHEEKEYYPKLQAKLTGAENAYLTTNFRAQFLSVKPI